MRFELDDYTLGLSDEELLADLRGVAGKLGKNTVTMKEYDKHGRCKSGTLYRRFGSWFNALDKAGLQRTWNMNISDADLLADLRHVANELGKDTVTQDDYNCGGRYGYSTITERFSSWFAALTEAGLKSPRRFYRIPDEELFNNIENVWIQLGRQPRKDEVQAPISAYSAGVYQKRFGSWRKALQAFVEYANSEPESIESESDGTIEYTEVTTELRHKTKRSISHRLRFLVFRRDNFKCNICGRSPATHAGTELVVDHIVAWSKGGETILSNLQTLCVECNSGKSNLDMLPG